MTIVKTAELSGRALDWAVAVLVWADRAVIPVDEFGRKVRVPVEPGAESDPARCFSYMPSTDWDQGGPIIDREGIATRKHTGSAAWYAITCQDLGNGERAQWAEFSWTRTLANATKPRRIRYDGPTALIAAMRCFVASKHGGEIDVPEELLS